ncbi:MAG: carboxypeptidase regulatory-like domain-containing protein [Deltaproteobacteria bacterium]|nr:carboxypeptidase regulatory-like domain-containing protein [Deltaproteobacteria bacterium]
MASVKYAFLPIPVSIGTPIEIDLPPRVFRARMTGMLFDTDVAFLLPSAMKSIRALKNLYDQHPGLSVLVNGHTDTVGSADYNVKLSDERAASVAAFMSDDVEAWYAHYTGSKNSKKWGTREDQYMLSVLPEGQPPYYVGPINGQAFGATSAAIKKFQSDHGLAADGAAGSDTRHALIKDYMALDGTTLPAGTKLLTHGCGESHPEVPTGDNVDEPRNRRVEVFFFEGDIAPPPRTPCNNCPEYPQWKAQSGKVIDLTQDLGWFDVTVIDTGGNPIENAIVELSGPASAQAKTSADGVARLTALAAGDYHCVVTSDNARDVTFPVTITTGEPPAELPKRPAALPSTPAPAQDKLALAPSPGPHLTTRENLIGDSAGGGAPTVRQGAPAAGGPQTGGSAGSGSQTGPNTALVIQWTGWTVILTEGPDDLKDAANEGKGTMGNKPWSSDEIHVVLDYTPNLLPAVGNAAKVPYTIPIFDTDAQRPKGVSGVIGVTHPDVTYTFDAVHKGPHIAPIVWVQSDPSVIKLGTKTPIERTILGRARLSLYAGIEETIGATWEPGVIDDVSLLVTVQNGDDPNKFEPAWDVGVLNTPQGHAMLPQAIAACHAKGIQCLAGFGLTDRGTSRIKRFDVWLDALTKMSDSDADAETTRFAQALVNFIDNTAGDATNRFDGLSFDIESSGLFGGPLSGKGVVDDAKLAKLRVVNTKFYKAVATELGKDNRICAVTVGGMMSDDDAITKGGLKSVPNSGGGALLSPKIHLYELAKSAPNIIIRPMAYDAAGGANPQGMVMKPQWKGAKAEKIPALNTADGLLEWHTAITKFALEQKKLHPGQFQLGIKRFTPEAMMDDPNFKPDPSKPNQPIPQVKAKADDGTQVKSGEGANADTPEKQNNAAKMLRPYRAGLILFAIGKKKADMNREKELNGLLNPGFAGKGLLESGKLGQPMQVPLDQQAMTRMGK